MPDETRLLSAFCVALLAGLITTRAAIDLAHRTEFLDRPIGHKQHFVATAYLGGAAVSLSFLVAVVSVAPELDGIFVLAACVVGLLAVGTLDDGVTLPIGPRIVAQGAAAVALFAAELGWEPSGVGSVDLALTVGLFVGVINAYNLMDNLDGAAATVAIISSLALGLYFAGQGAPLLGAVGLALAGACAGFLPFNLTRPSARIFLGDGGSMPLGLLISVLIANSPTSGASGWELVGVCGLLVGLPALDTALVIVSRRRRGVSLFTGGRDHLTHRLLTSLGTPRKVALALAVGQTCFVLSGLLLLEFDSSSIEIGLGLLVSLVIAALLLAAMNPPARATFLASLRRSVPTTQRP